MGGHMGAHSIDPEMYIRWMQFGAFSPILRTHSTKDAGLNKEPWVFADKERDIIRDIIKQRYSLAPYIYTMARHAYDTGVSLCRPMYYDYPDTKEAYSNRNEYMFGDNFLVYPITKPMNNGVSEQNVWLPAGCDWYELSSGTMLKGGQNVERRFLLRKGGLGVRLLPQLVLEGLELALLAAGAGGEAGELGFEILQVFLDRRGQELDLLGFLGAAQDLVLRFAEAALDGGDLKLGLRGERGGLGCLLAEGLGAGGERFAFFREARERIGAGQHARAFGGGAAGHAAARVHDLPVERDDAHAAAAGARHAHSVIERIADHSAAKGIFDDSAVLFITGNEAGSNRKEARLALADSVLQGLGLNRSKRKEGRAAAVAALEHLDGSLTVFLG